jgi:16S rRNA (guanine1207-N2)-methyltransferase
VLHFSSPRQRPAITGTWPRTNTVNGLTIRAHGGVFHTAGVDAGTSLLLDYLDAIAADVHSDAVDLGCGNGVISAHLARLLPQATIHATDVSWQAIDSTHLTAQANQLNIVTHWCDGLVDVPHESVDVVVTNPPFHRGTAQDHAPTLAMLADAARVLRPGGTLWCVYNNHLPWASHVQRTVGPTHQVVRNRRYTVIRTVRR